tara:strand:+ start:2082 stop:6938 length:4857 start_codon:yes stop_codon:yes gene_type:complete
MKKLFFLFSIFYNTIVFSQDYGLLFITTINSNPGNNGLLIVDIRPDIGPYTPVFDISTFSAGQTFYNFAYITNGFNSVDIIFSSEEVNAIGGCERQDTFTYNPSNFNQTIFTTYQSCIATVSVFPIRLESPSIIESPICPNENISLDFGWNWQYRTIKQSGISDWEDFPAIYQEKRFLSLSLNELLSSTELTDLTSIEIRTGANNQYTTQVIYEVIGCSPEWQNTSKTDETCFEAKDGSVTLTFDGDIDTNSDMRYYIYKNTSNAATPQAAFQGTTDSPFPPSSFAEVRLGSLVDNGNATYSGSSTDGDIISGDGRLEEGEYYVLYQEVDYTTTPVTVKSGELTPNFFTIDSPSQVITTGTFTAAACGNPAEIALAASGGGTPSGNTPNGYTYQYSVNNNTNWLPATNPLLITPTGSQQTIYVRAVVTGSNPECAGSELSYVIAQSTPQLSIVGNPTFVPPTTDTSTDGSIRIEIQNGTPNYTYVLNKVNGNSVTQTGITQTTFDFDIIDIGTYTITVTDAAGCSQTSNTIIVTKETVPTVTANPVNEISCFNSADGSVSATISDFGSNYKYRWIVNDTASAIQIGTSTLLTLANLNTGGTYVLRVASSRLDDADFIDPANYNQISFALQDPSPVIINSYIEENTSCNGGTDGSITLDISGGTSYEYAFGNNPTNWLPLTGNTISGLSPGSYIVTIRNQNACESAATTAIIIDEPDALVLAEVPNSRQNATTNGGNEGAIFLENVSGGTAPYSFGWTGPNGYTSTDQNPTNLSTGNYTVTVTDANGCTQTLGPLFIDQPGPLGITALNPTAVLCKGEATGSITAVVTGVAPFTYVWTKTGDAAFSAPNQATISGLTIGSYSLSLTDATGDPAVTSAITVTEPTDFLTATATTTPVSCFNGTDGQITISALGGTAPYQYEINSATGFQNSPTFNTLSSDVYSVTVIDANGCSYVITNIFVDQATQLSITPDQVLNISEAGQSDGAIFTTTTGGTLPYSYSWSGPNSFSATTKDISALAEGFYTLTVTDANNCTLSQSFNITEPGELVVNVQQTLFLACNGDDFAEITATIQGGVPNYSYQWFQITNGNSTALAETSTILANLAAGSYYLIVTDANNVTRTSATITIIEPNPLVATLVNKVDVLCSGDATGSIDVAVTGGTAPYEFYWNNELSTQNLNNLTAGDYYFDVVDANGCSEQLEITIEAPSNPLTIAAETVIDASEYQATDGSISIEATGGAPNYSFSWTRLSDNTLISNQNTINNVNADDYQLVITDSNGCTITMVYTIDQPDIIEETIVSPTCAGGDDGSIGLIVNKGNGTFSYSWSTGETTAAIANLSAGEYTVIITGFDQPISRTYTVEDPAPIQVNLGDDRVLCVDQVLELDATVENPTATYLWSSDTGFSSTNPMVVLTQQGNYSLTITTATGCAVTGNIHLELSEEQISAEFAASSQVFVGETLILVDISYPLPDRMEWIVPDNATVLKNNNDEAELVFNAPGEYEIGIITQRGPCTEIQTKTVLVLDNDPTVSPTDTENGQKLIEDFLIYPNPTSGAFTASVTMSEIGNISIKVFSFANNNQIAIAKERGKASYNIPFDISNMPAGVYAVLLETPYGNTLRKIIVR